MSDTYDLLVIGGGINGAGIARDAAGRGLRVLLVEKDDLASHTSSASTKLVHGGLRYLERHAFRLVREALAEREVLLANAPHLIRPVDVGAQFQRQPNRGQRILLLDPRLCRHLPEAGRHHHRRGPLFRPDGWIGAGRGQSAHHVQIAIHRRQQKRGRTDEAHAKSSARIAELRWGTDKSCLRISTMRQQRLHQPQPADAYLVHRPPLIIALGLDTA